MWSSGFECDPEGVEGDGEAEELTAILFGCDESDQFAGGHRFGEDQSDAVIDPLSALDAAEEPASRRGGTSSNRPTGCTRSLDHHQGGFGRHADRSGGCHTMVQSARPHGRARHRTVLRVGDVAAAIAAICVQRDTDPFAPTVTSIDTPSRTKIHRYLVRGGHALEMQNQSPVGVKDSVARNPPTAVAKGRPRWGWEAARDGETPPGQAVRLVLACARLGTHLRILDPDGGSRFDPNRLIRGQSVGKKPPEKFGLWNLALLPRHQWT